MADDQGWPVRRMPVALRERYLARGGGPTTPSVVSSIVRCGQVGLRGQLRAGAL